jgi:hypothetical protein
MEKERDPGTDVVNSEQVSSLYRKGIFSSTDYIILYNTPNLSISIIFILLILGTVPLSNTNVSVGNHRTPVVYL